MILEVNDLSMRFDTKDVFQDLSFQLEDGSMTALLGPNGTGKTTLIKILMGMLKPTAGSFKFDSDVKLGYVPSLEILMRSIHCRFAHLLDLTPHCLRPKRLRNRLIIS